MINKNSPVPIYYQLEEGIKKQIDNGDLKAGDLLPSERVLSEKFDVSRMTIRQAITNLVNEGLLNREKGKGTFVAEKKFEQPLTKLTSFSEDMKMRGFLPSTEIHDFQAVEISSALCKELNLQAGERGFEVSRVRLANNEPMAFEVTTLPEAIFKNVTIDLAESSLYEYVEEHLGLKIKGAKQTIEPAVATHQESEILKINAGDPVLILKRKSFLTDGRPFEYVQSVYRGDRYKFMIEMTR
ncbi:GntR family transcriptional regulator [Bacillus shivajii]|uniref:GntR family transcriptional regulator n=1 Tax=Bacillus shivajii TaxID=1983719 RepID=UPI001CF96CE7|nr:GntR family transcriptional regulator [Bacillus shivajii]UCZ53636.1 GntR family transcriptional regulator [Bacillus shivajii]